jgi:serine/threonine protein kinase/predicted ATPase
MLSPDRIHRSRPGWRPGLERESLARFVSAWRNSASKRRRERRCSNAESSSGWRSFAGALHAPEVCLGFERNDRRRIFSIMSRVQEAECLDEDIIAAFVDGQLDARMVEAVDAHLASCRECLWLVTAAAVAQEGLAGGIEASSREPQGDAGGEPEPAAAEAEGAAPPVARSSRWPERFERRQLIAQGGMGAVYYGYDRETNAAVAIKELKPGLASTQPALLGRFIREAEILRRLDHPNIVKMIASVTVGDQQQIVMEYVGGGSLRHLLRLERRLTVAWTAAIVLELADALSRAHHLGVIHRDIKPENVLLTKSGTPKLGDFGLAMMADAGLSTSNALLGTIAYLSPEALSGQTLDARADLWALGVMLFEMLTGKRPFEAPVPAGLVTAILRQPTPDLEALCPGVPVALVDLVNRLLEKDRNQRIASARQVGAELEAIARASGDSRAFLETLAGSDAAPPPPSAPRSVSRLPAATTGFVGRAAELAELSLLLRQRDVRAVTILGPGGMGKSSLALELARQITAGSNGPSSLWLNETQPLLGVFFVDLAPLASPDLIVSAVAQAVGFQFKPGGDPKRQLYDYLREKHLLLLMDNFEHVIGGAALVNEILQVAAGVKVLATSRERLGLIAEAQFTLSGMKVPEAWAGGDPGGDSAVQLFVDSARRTRFGFTPSSDEAAAILEICRLVHGMPLGIVLAASWIDTLSLHEIAGEILQNVDFLRSEAGDLPSRQQSIRAVFEHSWALLGPDERVTLAAVSIFRGGFTRAAAEVVAHASLRTLASLVSKSLLRRVPETGRYELHELLRQFAEARLGSVGSERDEAMDRLARYYSDFCGERSAHVIGPRRDPVSREIAAELDNVRLAIGWMLEQRQAARLWPMLHTLGQFYNTRRSRLEAEQVFGSIVSRFEQATPEGDSQGRRVLGLALVYQSMFTHQRGLERAAIDLVTRGVAILSEREPDGDYGIALVMYAWTCAGVGEPGEVVAKLEEGIALSRTLSGPWWLMRALVVSTRVYVGVVGDLAKAEACLRECVALQRQLNRGTIVFPDSLGALGLIRCTQGHRREGCELILDSLRSAERSDDAWAILLGLQFAARAHRDLGDYAAAETFVRRCIGHARELGSVTTVAWCHLTLGSVLRESGRFDEAIAQYELGAEQSDGDPALLAKAELGLGEVALERGEHASAEQYLRRSLAICEERSVARGAVAVWEALGYLACAEGRHDDALGCFRRAFELAGRQQKPATLMAVIAGVAHWCASSRQLERAAELTGFAQHHPATVHPVRVRRIEPLLEQLRTRLDETALEAALARGRQSSLERVFAESFP